MLSHCNITLHTTYCLLAGCVTPTDIRLVGVMFCHTTAKLCLYSSSLWSPADRGSTSTLQDQPVLFAKSPGRATSGIKGTDYKYPARSTQLPPQSRSRSALLCHQRQTSASGPSRQQWGPSGTIPWTLDHTKGRP